MSTKLSAALGAAAAATQKEVVGAQIVSKTLDAVNHQAGKKKKSSGNAMAASYAFNKDVLSAAYDAKGAIADITS